MFRRIQQSAVLGLVAMLSVPAWASPIIDGINQNASPAHSADTLIYYGSKDVGWYYTPAFSYDLDGIYGLFQAMGTANGSVDITKTVTVQIQSERPVNGGVVLGQGNFSVRTVNGGYLGSSFTPVHLTAGTKYFVDFLNVEFVGINLGSWANDINGNPQPTGGATVNLGANYRNFGTDTDFSTVREAYSTSGNVNYAGGEPILSFAGTIVPEPSYFLLVASGSIVLIRRQRVVS